MGNKLTRAERVRRQRRTSRNPRVNLDASKKIGEILLGADDGTTIEFAAGDKPEELAKFNVLAYTGKVVTKYGQRLVINIAGLSHKGVTPFIADHETNLRIGHGKVTKSETQVLFSGVVSSSSDTAKQFVADSKNGFPFEASVGVSPTSTRYIQEKQKVRVNGLDLVGPLLLIEKGVLREVSATTLGADDDTTSEVLSEKRKGKKMNEFEKFLLSEWELTQEGFEQLTEKMQAKIKLAFDASQKEDDEPEPKPKKKVTKKKVVLSNGDEEDSDDSEESDESNTPAGLSADEFHRWSEVMEKTEGNYKLAREALEHAWTDKQLQDQIDLAELRAGRSKAPGSKPSDSARNHQVAVMTARLMSGININLSKTQMSFDSGDVLIKHFKDEKVVDEALELGSLGLKQFIAMTANMHPASRGGYTCYDVNDTNEAMRFLQHQHLQHLAIGQHENINLTFNAGMMPNAFRSMCKIAMTQREALEPQCTPKLFAKGQNANFLPTPRGKWNAGERWKKLTSDGKLEPLGWGEEEFWQTMLCIRGGMLAFKYEDIINDNMQMIENIIAATVEMGDTEDWEFFTEFFKAADEPEGYDSFWTAHNSLSGADAVLNADNPIASYEVMQAAMMRMEKKNVRKNKEIYRVSVGGKWNLLYGCNLKQDIFRLFQDDSTCLDCEINSWRAWFRGKFNFIECINMDNESLYGPDAGKKNWALITDNRAYAPFEITTLRGSRGARVESVPVPSDCLGSAMRFWKVSQLNRKDKCGVLRARP